MKKTLALLLMAWGAFSCSSNETKEEPQEVKNTYTLVFFDKTQSVNPNDEFVSSKYSSALKSLVDANINTEGDILETYFVHENTSKGRALTIQSRTKLEDMEGLSPNDVQAKKNLYNLNIQKERNIIYNALLQKMKEPNVGSSNSETNISVSVPLIADAFKKYSQVKVYYFSDMVESLKNGRDFHKNAPQSADEASAWAKQDAEKYSVYSLVGADIQMILPFTANSSSKENNPYVTQYWKTFFETLGVQSVTEI